MLNGSMVPPPAFIAAVSELLGVAPAELFTPELIEASQTRHRRLVAAPPSENVGRHGRQPAYWVLRQRRIPQGHFGGALDCTGGAVSRVLNGFKLPDRRFVEAAADVLGMAPEELFAPMCCTPLVGLSLALAEGPATSGTSSGRRDRRRGGGVAV